jgi:collagenase-like PrtC family protease
MDFDLPWIPHEPWEELLAAHADRIGALHFRLPLPGLPDGRHDMGRAGFHRLAKGLETVSGCSRHALLNASFHPAGKLLDDEWLDDVVSVLDRLARAGLVDGVVYGDPLLLGALGRRAPALAAWLTAVPSVNCRIDSAGRARSLLGAAREAGFAPPDQITLDRRLNRAGDERTRIAREVRQVAGQASIALLANEGCLHECPYAQAHAALIAASHETGPRGCAEAVAKYGCAEDFGREPWRMIASPFLRPEDLDAVAGDVDRIKICGRSREPDKLVATARAYLEGGFAGNLLELLDSLEGYAQTWRMNGAAFGDDFWDRVDGCDRDCEACGYCADVAGRALSRRPGLEPYCT